MPSDPLWKFLQDKEFFDFFFNFLVITLKILAEGLYKVLCFVNSVDNFMKSSVMLSGIPEVVSFGISLELALQAKTWNFEKIFGNCFRTPRHFIR